jgi:hypothetical protein
MVLRQTGRRIKWPATTPSSARRPRPRMYRRELARARSPAHTSTSTTRTSPAPYSRARTTTSIGSSDPADAMRRPAPPQHKGATSTGSGPLQWGGPERDAGFGGVSNDAGLAHRAERRSRKRVRCPPRARAGSPIGRGGRFKRGMSQVRLLRSAPSFPALHAPFAKRQRHRSYTATFRGSSP